MNTNFNIEEFLNLDNYATNERIIRRKTNNELSVSNTNEFFTPYEIVKKMADKIPVKQWNDAELDALEPSFGNG